MKESKELRNWTAKDIGIVLSLPFLSIPLYPIYFHMTTLIGRITGYSMFLWLVYMGILSMLPGFIYIAMAHINRKNKISSLIGYFIFGIFLFPVLSFLFLQLSIVYSEFLKGFHHGYSGYRGT